MSQSWPLSQLINKSNGTCSVCLATRQVRIRGRTIHKHGPRHDPCPGSNKPPLQTNSQSQAVTDQILRPALSILLYRMTLFGRHPFGSLLTLVIKHIPKSARPSCASHLAALLRSVASNPDSTPKWLELFSWSHAVLQTPKRGDKRHNLAATIRQRIASFSARQPDGYSQSADPTQNAQRKNSRTSTISQAVSAKLEDRNVRAAIRLLMSQDSPAAPSPQSLSELREKHPRPPVL